MNEAIRVENLQVSYDDNVVLHDVTFSLQHGALIAIVGPNGAGKTTLMKAILGLIPSEGSTALFGDSSKKRVSKVAYVPQRAGIDWDFPMTVEDVVMQGRYRHMGLLKRAKKADLDAVKHALDSVSMSSFADRQIGELSGGQQQRVFLARALAQQSEIYFMDEPFQGVDAATEAAIINVLRELRDTGKTVVVVHHDLSTVRSYFDQVLLLNKTVIACGPVDDIFTTKQLQRTYGGKLTILGDSAVVS